MIKLGSHVGMAGKDMFLASVKEAESYGANVLMLYTGAPQNTNRSVIEDSLTMEAYKLMKENNIALEKVIVLPIPKISSMGLMYHTVNRKLIGQK